MGDTHNTLTFTRNRLFPFILPLFLLSQLRLFVVFDFGFACFGVFVAFKSNQAPVSPHILSTFSHSDGHDVIVFLDMVENVPGFVSFPANTTLPV